jgi:hypothetical protein
MKDQITSSMPNFCMHALDPLDTIGPLESPEDVGALEGRRW